VRLEVAPAEVAVVHGQPTIVVAQVFNTDDVINAYGVRVFGVDPTWVKVDHDRLSLFPGTPGTITLLIDVPRDYPAGELRVGIEVTPLVEPERRQVGESILLVPARKKGTIAIDPMTQAGGSRAAFTVTLGNEGNAPLSLTLGCTDPEDKVKVEFSPPVVELEPQQQVIVRARAKGRRPIMGNPAPRMLTVSASGSDAPVETFGSFIQRPLLGRGLISLFGLLMAVTIFAFVLTNTLGRVVDVAKVDQRILERAVNGDVGDRIGPANGGTAAGTVTLFTSGEPVSGVTVELFTGDDPTKPLSSAATASDGTFRLQGLDQGVYKLRFRGANFVEIWFGGGLTFEEAKEIEVVLGEVTGGLDMALGGVPGSITGKVIGTDPADAVVQLRLPVQGAGVEGAQVAEVLAGGDGTFVLEKVPAPASYDLVVSKEGFASERRRVNIAGAEQMEGVEIVLRKGDGLINGVVRDADGPLGGVAITASNATTETSTITLTGGTVGSYALRNLPTPGTYTLTFAKDGYATENLTVNLAQGEQLQGADVQLNKGTGSIAGTVTRGGTPVGGVRISVGVGDETIVTESLSVGEVGTYLLTGLPVPGTYTVTFSGSGLATQVRSVDLDPRQTANLTGLDAALTAATAQVRGTVKETLVKDDGSKEVAAAADVTVTLTAGDLVWTTRSADAPKTGEYLLRDVKPGTYTLTFTRVGSEPRSVLVNLAAGEIRSVDVTLEPRAYVTGVVKFKNGTSDTPLRGAFVVAYRVAEFPGTPAAQAVTNDKGEYKLTNLAAPETYIIGFRPPDGAVAKASQQLTLQAGQPKTGVNVTLDLGS
jgi:hypothetical protein